MVEFGAAVRFRVCGKVQGSSMGERWFNGIFLGKKAGTEENIEMRENGSVVRARAIREFYKVLTLKDYDELRRTTPDPVGTLRGVARDAAKMILKKTLMTYNEQDVRKADEKSSTNSVPRPGVRSVEV